MKVKLEVHLIHTLITKEDSNTAARSLTALVVTSKVRAKLRPKVDKIGKALFKETVSSLKAQDLDKALSMGPGEPQRQLTLTL